MCGVILTERLNSSASAVQALRPTLFIGVPRVFDKLYDGVYAKLKLARPLQRLLSHLAFWYKQRQIRAGYKWDKVLDRPKESRCMQSVPWIVSVCMAKSHPQHREICYTVYLRLILAVSQALALPRCPCRCEVVSAKVKSRAGGRVRLVAFGSAQVATDVQVIMVLLVCLSECML